MKVRDWQWPDRGAHSVPVEVDRTLVYADVALDLEASVALDMNEISPPITIIEVTP